MDILDGAGTRTESAGAAALSALLSRSQRALRRRTRARFPMPTLPQSQVDVLRVLSGAPGLSVHDLSAALHLAPNTTSTVVQHLVRQGYVTRQVDHQDRRVARLMLTTAAKQRMARWSDARATALAEALASLPKDDHERLVAALPALERLAALLETASE